VLTLADTSPRVWSAEAIALIGEVAERTWAALERARAEQALRRSEQRLRMAMEAAELGPGSGT
jgi:GAF domain-containing protein